MDFIWTNLGWVTSLFFGVLSWLVYAVRMNDKVNRMDSQLKELLKDFVEMKDDMQKISFSQATQQTSISKLESIADRQSELLHQLSINTEVIASWVKQQSGDTLIKRKH